ncbi:MAG: SDR family NAD(P)-dependent oxidoreductase, partial [Eubacteriales bacterium]
MAKEGHQLLVHGRNAKKLENVKNELLPINSNIKTYLADLSLLKNAENLAQEILATTDKIDVIINNAGVFVVDETTTEEGLDMRF